MRKLGDIYEELFGEKIEGAHRSINDVEATARIVNWYMKKEKYNGNWTDRFRY